MRKIPSQKTPWMQGRRSWLQSQKTEGSPGKISLRVLIWLTTVSEPRQSSKRSTMTPKGHTALQCHSRPGCSPAASERETTTQDTPQKGNKTTWGHGVNMAVYRWGTPGGISLLEERQKHLGSTARKGLLSLFNSCVTLSRLPKLWRKTRVIAILKPI